MFEGAGHGLKTSRTRRETTRYFLLCLRDLHPLNDYVYCDGRLKLENISKVGGLRMELLMD